MNDYLFVNLLSFFNILERFTWLRWLAHAIDRHGKFHFGRKIQWPIKNDAQLCGAALESILASYGIPIWSRGFDGSMFACYVPGQQVGWARYLLGKALLGAPLPPHTWTDQRARATKRELRLAQADKRIPKGWRTTGRSQRRHA
jgi:transposase InsO family protein